MATASDLPQFEVRLGIESAAFPLEIPVLAGPPAEELFPQARCDGRIGAFHLYRHGGVLLGCGGCDFAGGAESAATALFRDVFAAVRGRHLARIWNYVPGINDAGPEGLEVYRGFSRGRSLAFEAEYGVNFTRWAPASSAVGCGGRQLRIVFVATEVVPRHVENPRQVPAYDYPAEYGPRAPTFTRASLVRDEAGELVFISGTAAVRGHATVAPFDLGAQLACTLENLREISQACGLGPDLAAREHQVPRRWFKVYLRDAASLASTKAELERSLFQPGDVVTYLLSDICRRELCCEIEMTLRRERC